jgi:hypothetical protein
MPRFLLNRFVLVGLAVSLAAGLFYIFSTEDVPTPVASTVPVTAPTTAPVLPEGPSPVQKVASLAAALETLKCKDLSPLLDSIDGLKLQDLRQKLAPLGPSTEQTHWENTFYTVDGIAFVWHLVPTESAEGSERWELKHFREDADGPTLIEGRPFLDKRAAMAYRKKVVSNEATMEQKLSWNYGDTLTVTFTAADTVRELRVTSPLFQFDCAKSGCICEDYN